MRRASKEALSSGSLSALRIGMQLGGLAAKLNPAAIVVTHEGHAWERLVFSFTRSKISELTCIGYHHAALFRLQHAIRRNLAREYNPDVILTAGMLGKIQLENSPSLNETSISLLGSNRILKRIEFNSKIPITSDIAEPSVKTACLVLPEGILSECHLLFELSLIYAMQHLNQKFIWRLHPILSFEKLKKHSSIFNKIPDNIYLSGCDLDEDVQKCDSVLYRGSTAVVSAINAGLKPIYYQQNIDELSIDPIYQHLQGKEIVHNQKELNLALNKTINMETKQALQNFAQDFYTPLDVKVLKDAML